MKGRRSRDSRSLLGRRGAGRAHAPLGRALRVAVPLPGACTRGLSDRCGWLLVLASLLGCSNGEHVGSFAGVGGATAAEAVVGGAPGAFNTAPREMEPLRGLLDGCALTPAQPEGLLHVPGASSRTDIREDRQGAILRIRLWVDDAAHDCSPIPGADVEIWHPDAQGIYSGVRDANGRYDTTGQTFLRGTQKTDGNGYVEFLSIYPGWSEGRAPHVNFRVTLPNGESLTSEMYFPQDITEAIFRQQHYRPPNQDYVSNASDPLLNLIDPEARWVLRAGVFVYSDGFMSELVVGMTP
jgi:protocatechuate 3,4-dioxygenase beta subunit